MTMGAVNGEDLSIWQTGYGIESGASHGNGDADADHDVDGGDFLFWQTQFSDAGNLSNQTSVPEPTTIPLLLLGSTMPLQLRQRR